MFELPEDKIIRAIAGGIKCAQYDYELSAENWVCNAPEYLISVYIYQYILRLRGKKYLTFEEHIGDIEYFLKIAKRGPKPRDLRVKGRCDIILWSSDDEPRAIIEVKRGLYGYAADVKRLSCLFQRIQGMKLEFAVLACCVFEYDNNKNEKQMRDRINLKIRKAETNIKAYVGNHVKVTLQPHSICRLIIGDEKALWRPVCYLLKPIY